MSPSPEDWRKLLERRLRADRLGLQLLDAYYDGTQPLSFVNEQLMRQLEDRVRPLVLGWPAMVVDSVEERLDVEGFRYGVKGNSDDRLWEIWQANNLDTGSQMCHLDALRLGRGFAVVTGPASSGDAPIVSVESPLEMSASWDPQSRLVRAAYKEWQDADERVTRARLYLPGGIVGYVKPKGESWKTDGEPVRFDDSTGVNVVAIPNRMRTTQLDGTSEITRTVRALTDAAMKMGTDMMVGGEFHALPRRYVMGMSPGDFVDGDGRALTKWEIATGMTWLGPAEAKPGQFAQSDLSNFHETIRLLAMLLLGEGCLPPHYVGLVADQPASADAIRSMESRLVKRAERRQRSFGDGWEQVMRLCLAFSGKRVPKSAQSLETLWANPGTPTTAQAADAATKLVGADIIPSRQALEDLGYTEVQITRILAWQAEESANAPEPVAPPVAPVPPDGNVTPMPMPMGASR